MKRLLAAAFLALPAVAAAAAFSVELKAPAENSLRGHGGLHAADSRTGESLVRVISPGIPFEGRGTVRVLAMNLGQTPFRFGPDQVTLTLRDGTVLAEVPISKFDEGAELIAHEMRIARNVDARVKSSLGARAATGSTAAADGLAVGRGAGAAADGMAARQDRRSNADLLPGMRTLRAIDEVMQSAEVGPQEAAGGYLLFELPAEMRKAKADQPLLITVRTGRDLHRFKAVLRRR